MALEAMWGRLLLWNLNLVLLALHLLTTHSTSYGQFSNSLQQY
jgi:hypothetical protein